LSDLIQRIRQEMPATTAHIYLNTGTFGPLPTCVVQAMQEYLQAEWRDGRLGAASFENMKNTYDDARAKVARLLHADASEIALTDNTGEGCNIISYGFNWHEGDEVITTNHEHTSALVPLFQIRKPLWSRRSYCGPGSCSSRAYLDSNFWAGDAPHTPDCAFPCYLDDRCCIGYH